MEKKLTRNYNKIESYIDFVHYCLRRLGGGMINIEVSDEQIKDRISDAIQYFREYHVESTQLFYWVHKISPEEVEKGFLEMPEEILDITDIKTHNPNLEGTDISGLDSIEYAFWNSFWGYNGEYGLGIGVNTGLIYYELTMSELQTMEKVLNAGVQFQWQPRTNKLYLYAQMLPNKKILISGYKMIDPETNNAIWDSDWLKSYATALLGIQWGTNLSKFGNIPTAGGIQLDADEILSRYTTEKEKLEEAFMDRHMEPILPTWG